MTHPIISAHYRRIGAKGGSAGKGKAKINSGTFTSATGKAARAKNAKLGGRPRLTNKMCHKLARTKSA